MVNLPFLISRRYLLAKKSHNAINIITGISVGVLAMGTMAMVLILSVFNGLEDLIAQLYNTVRPDIEIRPAKGKFFDRNLLNYKPQNDQNVACYSDVLEDMALIKYQPQDISERQTVVKFKAVSSNYQCISNVDSMVFDGSFLVQYGQQFFTVMGYGVASRLDLRLNIPDNPVYFYYPKSNANSTDVLNAFNIELAMPAGVIALQQEDDDKLVYVSLPFAQKLMDVDSNIVSAVELQLKKNVDLETFAAQLQSIIGDQFVVKDRRMLNATLYKITQSEKWSGFLILAFILLLASVNVIGSITVLILEKKSDIKTYFQLGFNQNMIRKIFVYEGLLISIVGGLFGLVLGYVLVLIQKYFQIIPMNGSFAVTAFPVSARFSDFLLVGGLVILLGFISTLIPIRRLKI